MVAYEIREKAPESYASDHEMSLLRHISLNPGFALHIKHLDVLAFAPRDYCSFGMCTFFFHRSSLHPTHLMVRSLDESDCRHA